MLRIFCDLRLSVAKDDSLSVDEPNKLEFQIFRQYWLQLAKILIRLVEIYAKTVLLWDASGDLEVVEYLDAIYLQARLLEEHVRKGTMFVLRGRSDVL